MRLVDADKLLKFFTVDTANQTYRFGTVKKQIERAPTVNAIPIPEGATNGDMIEIMFPDKSTFNGGEGAYFMKDWWNTPYKKGVEKE